MDQRRYIDRASWDAAELLRVTPRADQWSASGPIGGTHVGTVMNGPADWDILCLVRSTWDDLMLIAALPSLLASEAVRHGVPPGVLPEPFRSATADRHDRTVALLEVATPGPWTTSGAVTVTGTVDGLDVAGQLKVTAGDTLITEMSVCTIADIASVNLLIEGLDALRVLAAAEPAA